MRSAGQLLVDWLQRRGKNVDDSLAIPGNWIGEFFIARGLSESV
jgi:hypothetical protein